MAALDDLLLSGVQPGGWKESASSSISRRERGYPDLLDDRLPAGVPALLLGRLPGGLIGMGPLMGWKELAAERTEFFADLSTGSPPLLTLPPAGVVLLLFAPEDWPLLTGRSETVGWPLLVGRPVLEGRDGSPAGSASTCWRFFSLLPTVRHGLPIRTSSGRSPSGGGPRRPVLANRACSSSNSQARLRSSSSLSATARARSSWVRASFRAARRVLSTSAALCSFSHWCHLASELSELL